MRNSTTLKISRAKTFRLSSCAILTKKVRDINGHLKKKGWGGNLQNIEKSMRRMYIPDEGKKFGQIDQAGAEALVFSYLCRNGQLRTLFKCGIKPHTFVAFRLFKDVWPRKLREHRLITSDTGFDIDALIATPIDQLKKHPHWKMLEGLIKDSDNWTTSERYYYFGKQTCHSGNYGITPPMFRLNVLEKSGGKINISKEDSEHFLMTYHSLFPEIQECHVRIQHQVERTRILYNFHGHPYHVTVANLLDSAWKELYAWIPQSTVGEITNIAYTKMQRYIEENNLPWDMLANTHDSFLTQFPPEDEHHWASVANKFMCQPFKSPVDGEEFAMKAELATGYNWAPYKEESNPEGLREIRL